MTVETFTVEKRTEQSNQLIVAMDVDLPGYFTLNDNNFGYQHDLLQKYAESRGKELVIDSHNDNFDKMMINKSLDIIVALPVHIKSDYERLAVPVYSTEYVLLSNRKDNIIFDDQNDIKNKIKGKSVTIPYGFYSSPLYSKWLDDSEELNIYKSSKNFLSLIHDLSNGKIDYLVCEKSEAQLACNLVRNIKIACNLEDKIEVSVIFGNNNDSLLNDFKSWLCDFKNSKDIELLENRYFKNGLWKEMVSGDMFRTKNGISAFDSIMKSCCVDANLDWRLISAIAYNESRFNPFMISPRGARGLMQIMPSVAKEFNVELKEVMNPKENIGLAIKLIKHIEKQLLFSSNISEDDKYSIILASYNVGVGHIVDLRNLARKLGINPDSWSALSELLINKSQYSEDEVVKHGVVKGTETLAFVENVMNKYGSYRNRYKY